MRLRQGGFTLLEIVVVLMLVGIITSFALLSVSADHTRDLVESEGQRLAALLRYSRDAATLRLRDRGLRISETGYQLLERRGRRWLPVADGPAGREQLPAGLRLQLTAGDLPDALKSSEDKAPKPDERPPQVWIFATGELLPFELELADATEEHRFVVAGDASGRLETRFESRVR
jgi:general secretion pathway protein H